MNFRVAKASWQSDR